MKCFAATLVGCTVALGGTCIASAQPVVVDLATAPRVNVRPIKGVSPKPFEAFDLRELRTTLERPTLKLTDTITERGRTVTVSDLVDQLNGVERWLNSYGRSLREDTKVAPTIGTLDFSLRKMRELPPRAPQIQQPCVLMTTCDGRLRQLPPDGEEHEVGDPGLIAFRLNKSMEVANDRTEVRGRGNLNLDVLLGGTTTNVGLIACGFRLPQGSYLNDPERNVYVSVVVDQGPLTDQADCRESEICKAAVSRDQSLGWGIHQSFIVAVIVGIPIILELGLNNRLDGTVTAEAAPKRGSIEWAIEPKIVASGRLYAELAAFEAGGWLDVDIVAGKFEESGHLDLIDVDQTVSTGTCRVSKDYVSIDWQHTETISLTALDGEMSLYIKFKLGPFSKRYKLGVAFEGVTLYEGIEEKSHSSVCRPRACDNTKTRCDGLCVDLFTDASNCGGCGVVCATGRCISGRFGMPMCAP